MRVRGKRTAVEFTNVAFVGVGVEDVLGGDEGNDGENGSELREHRD